MYEVEVKVRADHGPVRERLSALAADHVGCVTQVDTYYNAPDRDFAATDEALRVRRETDDDGERVLLTYKGPLVDDSSKTREEAETRVVDGDAVESILAGLGYDAAATVRKERDRFALSDCRVTLDRVTGVGTFVEAEYHDGVSEADIDSARATVRECLEELGLDPDAGIQTSYLGLVLASESAV
jgi:adenylate cyclase class 2